METAKGARPIIPMDTPHEEARRIMYGYSNECNGCNQPIANIEDATALLVLRSRIWKLLHSDVCTSSAIFSGTRRGISPQAHRRMFK